MDDVDPTLASSIARAWQLHAEALFAVYQRHPEPALADSILRYWNGAFHYRALVHDPPPPVAPTLPCALRAEFDRLFSESVEPYESPPLEPTSLLSARGLGGREASLASRRLAAGALDAFEWWPGA